jgi:hypothetical protein
MDPANAQHHLVGTDRGIFSYTTSTTGGQTSKPANTE